MTGKQGQDDDATKQPGDDDAMADMNAKRLRDGLRDAAGPNPDSPSLPTPDPTYRSVERLFEGSEQADLLKHIPPWVVKKSWFALAHLMLEPGSTVVDLGAKDGMMAYTMAVLAPTMQIVGLDKNPDAVKTAAAAYDRPNLSFRCADVMDAALDDGSVDAIICNYFLHEVYSGNDFNQRCVRQTLRECHRYLKPGGQIFIRDYAEPPQAQTLVLMEMPDTPSKGSRIEDLSEPDLLVWYSEYATMQDDAGACGFYLEELPPRFPRTRLFRLPHKWAYEFIMRKDARARWQDEVPKEYTFYDERDYHKTLNSLGLRVVYSAPHWDETYIKKHFEKNFRLMDEAGNPIGTPATSFAVVAQKVDVRDAVLLTERRKAKAQESKLHVVTYRNEVDGRLIEVVSRNMNTTEIIPFSVMSGGRLVVYLHEGVPRGLVNAVPRGGRNLDGKFWSGHLTEAVTLDTEQVTDLEQQGDDSVRHFIKQTMGLQVSMGQSLVAGPSYFPNPRFIAEKAETRYISVEPHMGRFVPNFVREDLRGFASTGAIRAYDAQSVLNAISVGVLPAGNLEMQLLMLFSMLEIHPVDWAESPLVLKEEDPDVKLTKVSDILKKTEGSDKRFREMKANVGNIKLEKSVFVDEGFDPDGVSRGLAARDVDFAVNDEMGMNVAVILPLSKIHSGEVMAGVIIDYMPVPERYAGDGQMVTLPMLPLPKDIQNVEMARKYIAQKYEIKVDQVSRLGEPYFSHVGLTPQRIFPFAINCPHTKMARPSHGVLAYAPVRDLSRLHWKDLFERYDIDMLKVSGRVNKRIGFQNEQGLNWGFDMPLAPRYADAPFTTGAMVDVRMMPMTGQPTAKAPPPLPRPAVGASKTVANQSDMKKIDVATVKEPAASLPEADGAAANAYLGVGGFSKVVGETKRGEAQRGSGGKAGGKTGGGRGSSGRDPKPRLEKKPKLEMKPEPKN